LDEEERARATLVGELDVEVRLVGELFRRAGSAMERGNASLLGARLRDLRAEVLALRRAGRTRELLALRALQGRLFIEALDRFQESNQADTELLELGGEFARDARPRFFDAAGKMRLGEAEARLLFRVRWGRLTGTYRASGFGPSMQELRAHYCIFLRFPSAPPDDVPARVEERVKALRALGKIDARFPTDVALGFQLAKGGDPNLARLHLARYLESDPGGAFALQARNALFYIGQKQ
jgi:hypothetical protein